MFFLIVMFFIILIVYFKWKYLYWRLKGVESPSPIIPFGNMYDILMKHKTRGQHFADMYHTFKAKKLKYFGCYLFEKPALVLIDPEIIKSILVKDFLNFTDRIFHSNEENDPLNANLSRLSGLKWRKIRTKMITAFSTGRMKIMVELMRSVCKNLEDFLKVQQNSVNITEITSRYCLDAIASCACGFKCNSLEDPECELRSFVKNALVVNPVKEFQEFLLINFPWLMKYSNIRFNKNNTTTFFVDALENVIRHREKNHIERIDFLQILIKLKDENEGFIKIEDIAAQVFTFLTVGVETISSVLSFCLYELAMNTDAQNKLRKEILCVLHKHNGCVSYEAVAALIYMNKCIKETLRKYSPLHFLTRRCTKRYKIPGSDLVLDKNTSVFIPLMGLHYDEEYYHHPNRFDPERFDNAGMNVSSDTWLPFGRGPRDCIGNRFSLLEMKLGLISFCANYEFTLDSNMTVPLVMDPKRVVLSVNGGIWLNVVKVST